MNDPLKDNHLYTFGPFRLDASERRLSRDGVEVPLGGKAFDLLLALVRSAGHLKTRDEIFEAVWPDVIVEDINLSWNMNALRKALGDKGPPHRYIETLRGHGYRFIATVETEEPAAPRPQEPSSDQGNAARGSPSRRRRRLLAGFGLLAVAIAAAFLAWYFTAFFPSDNAHRAGGPSIAVLPFENLSADPANAYFVRGIQDLIITKLAGIGALKVISRTSTESYPSHPENLHRVAHELAVATILEGSVQKIGNSVLINVQLIDADTGGHLWARAYTRELDNVFNVESSVARQVAAALKLKLLPGEKKRLARLPTRNPQAYDLFLRANDLATQVERRKAASPLAAATRSEALYRRAIAKDPGFALARARLSILDSFMYWYDLDHTAKRLAMATSAAEEAVKSGIPQAHIALGYVYYWGHRHYGKAIAEFQTALKTLPNSTEAIGAIGFIHRRQGRWTDALNELQHAEVLDPRNPLWYNERGVTLTQLRRYREAQEEFDHAFSVSENYYRALGYKALVQLLIGELSAAQATLQRIPPGINPRGMPSAVRFECALLARKPNRALQVLGGIPNLWIIAPLAAGRTPVSLLRAHAWALKGNTDKAKLAYQNARSLLLGKLSAQPDDPNLLSLLGMTEAALGEKTRAIKHAVRATQLLPVKKDALQGPAHLMSLAEVYARSGKARLAVNLLRRLLDMPAGLNLSPALLQLAPVWDPIRHDPTFQALLKQNSPKALRANSTHTAPVTSGTAPAAVSP